MVIDTKTTYFVNKRYFQYKIILEGILNFFGTIAGVFTKATEIWEKRKSATAFGLKSAYDSIRVRSIHLVKENNENDLPFCRRNVPNCRKTRQTDDVSKQKCGQNDRYHGVCFPTVTIFLFCRYSYLSRLVTKPAK